MPFVQAGPSKASVMSHISTRHTNTWLTLGLLPYVQGGSLALLHICHALQHFIQPHQLLSRPGRRSIPSHRPWGDARQAAPHPPLLSKPGSSACQTTPQSTAQAEPSGPAAAPLAPQPAPPRQRRRCLACWPWAARGRQTGSPRTASRPGPPANHPRGLPYPGPSAAAPFPLHHPAAPWALQRTGRPARSPLHRTQQQPLLLPMPLRSRAWLA